LKELSLNILDIIENSINAKAKNIYLAIVEDDIADKLEITVKDDGVGMDDDFLKIMFDPFTTTSTKKKVGLDLPLLKEGAEECGGGIRIESKKKY
jgi:signal transduction histidine kinase